MYRMSVSLRNGFLIEGYITDLERDKITKSLKTIWPIRYISFSIYEHEDKTDNNTGWGHKCYVELKRKDIICFTCSHTRYNWWS